MSTATASSTDATKFDRGDAFGIGVLVMLVVSGFQRVVGLLRGVGFCHFLSDAELGLWSLANSFFVLAVPLALLGLPRGFGKYVEYYRHRGQLGLYIRRVVGASTLGIVGCSLLILTFATPFSHWVLGTTEQFSTIVLCVVALVCLCIYSVLFELVAALRQIRVLSLMQFGQSCGFAVIGLIALAVTRSWVSLLPSFALANLLALLPGLWIVYHEHRDELSSQTVSSTGRRVNMEMWRRILPFALMLWILNLMSNLFDVSDRYMLLHLVQSGGELGQQLVGQRHAAYLLPNLLTSISLTLAGILLPYLSSDWEGGRSEAIRGRMRQMLLGMCIAYLGLAAAAMLAAPVLYTYGFSGRYNLALQIIPLCLLQATWTSLFGVAETYLLCAERVGRLIGLLIGGLVVNLGLNWLLIPQFGIHGAIAATASANLAAMMLVYWQIHRQGCSLGWRTYLLSLTPIVMLAGPLATMLAFAAIVWVAGRTNWLLSDADRQAIDAAMLPKLRRVGFSPSSLWP